MTFRAQGPFGSTNQWEVPRSSDLEGGQVGVGGEGTSRSHPSGWFSSSSGGDLKFPGVLLFIRWLSKVPGSTRTETVPLSYFGGRRSLLRPSKSVGPRFKSLEEGGRKGERSRLLLGFSRTIPKFSTRK